MRAAKTSMCQYIARYEAYCGQCYKTWWDEISFKELHDIVQAHDMNALYASGDKKAKRRFDEMM